MILVGELALWIALLMAARGREAEAIDLLERAQRAQETLRAKDGQAVAVATDFNPGTAPSYHLPVAMSLACTLQRMTPAEVLRGATIVAARGSPVINDISPKWSWSLSVATSCPSMRTDAFPETMM